ncbi:NAD(P)-dependent alcohol dehydrogenase (plasmid) [Klebsiella michiganensis]|nr:NAD(P)-dependent alcohol dehydrogenase [Klebsiella michiganensis]WKK01084.1 NAD(P)-dependent alcohol dehydrogenase [Klebsiella michiganensis]WKK07051.1 NAD(P)-dependent alcohol dehydrogenase [Klebsiella michiganensis]
MKGFAMLRIGEVGWIEKSLPEIGPLDALLKPIVVAPCTTDIKTVWKGALGERFDMILGHECCAQVVKVGSLVKDFKPGDKVVVPAVTPNWSSPEAQCGCSSHSNGLLNGWRFSNYADGVFSEYFMCNDADGNLAHIPAGVKPEEAVMLADMIPPGFQSVELADVQFGDTVLVIGIGPVGLMAVAAAVMRGAGRVIAIGSRPQTIELAKYYGATDVLNHKDGPLDEKIMSMTNGKGVDRICICGGTSDSYGLAVKSLKPGGKIASVISLAMDEKISISSPEWGFGMADKQIIGSAMTGGRLRMEKLGALLASGRLNVKPLITHTFSGWEQLESAIMMAKTKPEDFIKAVVLLDKD